MGGRPGFIREMERQRRCRTGGNKDPADTSVRGPVCCGCGSVSETQSEQAHTSHGNVKNPVKTRDWSVL